ncbi:MAG TPA: GNAT family N-acetyltransferase [Anaerolineales bacterium]|nr:GNAT family N-acetyltransferase [Anaerolineales bacterium]
MMTGPHGSYNHFEQRVAEMFDEIKGMTPEPTDQQVRFRPGTENDADFLYALHAATMKEYVDKTWGWDDAFQEAVFRKNYVPAEIQVITFAEKDMGMLSLEERLEDVFLRAIEIHPEYQGQGIGTAIIKKIIAEGALKMKPVFLHVLKVNPAKRLYERLGFSVVSETSTHFQMRTSLSK